MKSPLILRAGLMVASTVSAGLLAAWAGRRLLGPAAVELRAGEGVDAVLAAPREPRASVRAGEPFRLEPIEEVVARELFVMDKFDFRYDPDCYYRYRRGIDARIDWPEHPLGFWTRRTNGLGLREDADQALDAGELGVLVTGDSHTDGVCSNAESFANGIEATLGEVTGREVVAWNAGVVGYSFYNYLGVLRKYLDREPDAFVVAVYGGNDFLEVLRPHHYLRGTTLPPRREGYRDKISAAREVSSTALAQGLNQVLYFQEFPDQIEAALEAAHVTAGEIKRLCDERGIRLLFAYLPPAFEASWPALDRMAERAKSVLEISDADLGVARRIADEFLGDLSRQGIEWIDCAPLLRAHEAPCFWERDLHLNLIGHRLVAERIAGRLARPPAEPLTSVLPEDGEAPLEEGDELSEGEWLEGQRHGLWTRRYPGGALHSQGHWERGRRVGEWSWFYESGAPKKSGRYEDGQPVGEWREWYRSGPLRRRGVWADGTPHGFWRQLYENGQLASEGAFDRGRREGYWTTWYEAGGIDTRATYRAGELEGLFKRWDPSGELVTVGSYAAGERSGPWQTWWSDGGQRARGEFLADRREGPWMHWSAEGEVDRERSGWYRAGTRVSGLRVPDALGPPGH